MIMRSAWFGRTALSVGDPDLLARWSLCLAMHWARQRSAFYAGRPPSPVSDFSSTWGCLRSRVKIRTG